MLRKSMLALMLALSLLATACGNGDGAQPEADGTAPTDEVDAEETGAADGIRVGMAYDIGGRGDLSFNDSAAAGLDRAAEEFNIEPRELEPAGGGENRDEILRLLAQEGYELVFAVGFAFAEHVQAQMTDFPDTRYGLIDGFIEGLDESSNVVALGFAEEQGSFLVGAAAALNSETGHIGFIGGVEIDLIQKFQAGFEAGARHINPDITIDVRYISQPPDFSGFTDPARGKEVALGLYEAGADVVYHAAGGSGAGLFEAAMEVSEDTGTKVWAIGVDSDQYQTAPPEVQEYILTSMLKKVDVAVYETVRAHVDGSFTGGYRTFDLESGGVDYSTSGGFVDDIADQLDELKQQIIAGEIEVPTAP